MAENRLKLYIWVIVPADSICHHDILYWHICKATAILCRFTWACKSPQSAPRGQKWYAKPYCYNSSNSLFSVIKSSWQTRLKYRQCVEQILFWVSTGCVKWFSITFVNHDSSPHTALGLMRCWLPFSISPASVKLVQVCWLENVIINLNLKRLVFTAGFCLFVCWLDLLTQKRYILCRIITLSSITASVLLLSPAGDDH